MKIFVKVLNSEENFDFDMEKSCTVKDIKAKIYEQKGTLPEMQTLIHSGLMLCDDRGLSECNIQRNSTIFLAISMNSNTMITVKVQSAHRHAIIMRLDKMATVRSVKVKLSDELITSPDQQRLVYAGQEMEDDRKLCDYNVHEQSTLQLITKVTVYIRMHSGSPITLHLDDSPTVNHVKEKIETIKGISCDQQKLIYNGRQLDGDCSLSNYNIASNSEIDLVLKGNIMLHIQILKTGKVVDVEVDLTDTIAEVKEQLFCLERIPVSEQTLILWGLKLPDDHLLSHCDIQNNSMLSLVLPMRSPDMPRPFQIQVYNVNKNETITLQLSVKDTVHCIKVKIFNKIGVLPDKQRLIHGSVELKDEKRLSEYNIQNGSIIQLLEKQVIVSQSATDTTQLIDSLYPCHPELKTYINMESLMPYLNKYRLVTGNERYELNDNSSSPQRKTGLLLQFLERKGDVAVKNFLQALQDETCHAGHVQLCTILREKGVIS